MTTVDVAGAANVAEKVVEDVMKVEPMIAGGVGMFVPGAAPIVALVQPWLVLAAPYVERALKDVANSNGGDVLNAFMELMAHISAGKPNSSALTPAAGSGEPDSSALGSG